MPLVSLCYRWHIWRQWGFLVPLPPAFFPLLKRSLESSEILPVFKFCSYNCVLDLQMWSVLKTLSKTDMMPSGTHYRIRQPFYSIPQNKWYITQTCGCTPVLLLRFAFLLISVDSSQMNFFVVYSSYNSSISPPSESNHTMAVYLMGQGTGHDIPSCGRRVWSCPQDQSGK